MWSEFGSRGSGGRSSATNDEDQPAGTGRRHDGQPTLPPLAFILWFGHSVKIGREIAKSLRSPCRGLPFPRQKRY